MFTEPVSGKDFFGRSEILEVLSKRLDALKSGYRQNIALTGRMLSGKSSILCHFLESIKNDSVVPVYIEVADEPFDSFAEKFITTLLYNFLKSKKRDLSKDSETLLAEAACIIPRTAASISDIKADTARRQYTKAYKKLLDLTSVFKEETGRPCVVILDEFHNLEKFRIENPFLHLGKIIMVQKSTMYIVSSSEKNRIRKILAEKLSLLFGNFEVIEVSGFDSKTARSFLKDKIAPVEINDYYSDYILSLTDKNPFYLDAISGALKNFSGYTGLARVNVGVIKEALTGLLYNAAGTLNQHFTGGIHFAFDRKSRKTYLDILFALAKGPGKARDISKCVKKAPKAISEKLDFLCEADIIYRCGMFYRIQDKLFEYWLKNVYFGNEAPVSLSPREKSLGFMKFIESDIENYLIERNRDLPARVRDLFNCFGGETVEIEKKTCKLPKFIKIEAVTYAAEGNCFACQGPKRYWVLSISDKRIEETDIIDLIRKSDRVSKNAPRKVLVAPGGIDSNALLLAKEKRVWVWGPDALNSVSRLYGKQDMVV